MRLGLLGPALGNHAALARAGEFLLNTAKVSRAIYIGDDDALEHVVSRWAESLVGPDPSDDGIYRRAFEAAASGTPEQIDKLVRNERARLRLRALERLPKDGLRTIEMFGDRVAVLIYDKALLDEEDIYSASFLVYGKSDEPLIKKIGNRWFITPGAIGAAGGGAVVFDDQGDEVTATIYDSSGNATMSEGLVVSRTATLKVLSEPGGAP